MRDAGMQLISSQPGLMSRIGRELGLDKSAVPQWRKVPAERLVAVSRITGIPEYKLRPDIYPPPSRRSVRAMPVGVPLQGSR